MHHAPGTGDDLEDWEDRLLRTEARVFARRRRLRWSDEDDLWQEAALAWVRQRDAWDPAKASAATYLKVVARRAMQDVAKEEHTVGRAAARTAQSIDEPIGDGLTLESRIAARDPVGDVECRLDLVRALTRLTPRQRAVFHGRTAGYQLQELTEILGVHRDTLHRDKLRTREVFRDEGLISSTDPT